MTEGWRPLPYEPVHTAYHPCEHRWQRKHPHVNSFKNTRNVLRPFSDRAFWLAQPLLRRLLNVYIPYYDVLSPERRERLRKLLLEYGYTDQELEDFLRQEKRRLELARLKAEAGPFDVIDEDGKRLSSKGKAKKKKGTGKKKKAGGKSKKGKKKKAGKNKKGKKKTGKKVKGKKKAGKKTKGKKKGKAGTKKTKGGKNQEEETESFKPGKPGQIKNGWVNFKAKQLMALIWALLTKPVDETYISKAPRYFDIQAHCILDLYRKMFPGLDSDTTPIFLKVITCSGALNLAVWIAQKIITPSAKIADSEVPKLLALKGVKMIQKTKGESKKKPAGKIETEEELTDDIDQGSTEGDFEVDESETPKDKFLRTAVLYNPKQPEFIYSHCEMNPEAVKISFDGNDEVWTLRDLPNIGNHPLVPRLVVHFHEELRPKVMSAGYKARDDDAWYIMSTPDYYNENATMWDDIATEELIENILQIYFKMLTMPLMSMKGLLELLNDFKETVSCAEVDEDLSPEDQLLDDKRTIVLERMFVDFFGANCRDYNEETAEVMRMLCRRAAVLIRYLYEITAQTLWLAQSKFDEPPSQFGEEDEHSEIDDAKDLDDWTQWLDWLLLVASDCKSWASWLKSRHDSMERVAYLADQKELLEWTRTLDSEAQAWIGNKYEVQDSAAYFEKQAASIGPVNNRELPLKYYQDEWQDNHTAVFDEWVVQSP